MSLIGTLCWRTKDGHDLLLKQVSVKEFRELKSGLTGVPTVFAVWPSPWGQEEEAMTDKKTPPDDWVLLRAAKQCGWAERSVEELRWHYLEDTYNTAKAFRALCDMIERYEQPPVDRKWLCAKEAFDEWMSKPATEDPMKAIAVRAIELFEEGFGK